MTRREILKTMLLLGAQAFIPLPDTGAEASLMKNSYSGKLSLYNQHTEESLSLRYLDKKGRFDKNACRQLNRFFRCHYDSRVHQIDPRLFLLLDAVRCQLGATGRPYSLISGYRSPCYNRLLCSEDGSVARHSYHTSGMAADIFMEGVALRDIGKVAKRLKVGGVGRYTDFIHLDVGPVRTW